MPFSIIESLFVKASLGPYLVGVCATLALFLYYSSISNMGVLSAAALELPYSKGSGEVERLERIRQSAFVFAMGGAFVFILGMMAWAIMSRSKLDEPLFLGLCIYAIYVPVQQWLDYYITLLRTNKEFVFLGKNQAFFGILASINNVVGVMLFGFIGLLTATVVTQLAQATWLARRVGYLPSLQVHWHETRRLVSIGVPLMIYGFAFTAIKTVDNILVVNLLGTNALGLYSLALMGNTLVFSAANAMGGVLTPRRQEAYGRQHTADTLGKYVVRPTLIIGELLPVGIGVFFLSVPTIVHWLLPRFVAGLPAFKLILMGTYFLAGMSISASALASLNKQFKTALIIVAALVLTAVLALVFVRLEWGLEGIALATVLGYAMCFVSIHTYALRHWMGWRQISIFLGNLTLPFVYSALVLYLLDQYRAAWLDGLFMSLGLATLKILLFLVTYFLLIVLMERKTHLIADFIRPMIQIILQRTTA